MHFSRRNRNAAWILPFPNNPRRNPDDVLRPMTRTQVKRMEAELLAGQMMQVLEEQQSEAAGGKVEAAVLTESEKVKEQAVSK
jgi:hypothetical protein